VKEFIYSIPNIIIKKREGLLLALFSAWMTFAAISRLTEGYYGIYVSVFCGIMTFVSLAAIAIAFKGDIALVPGQIYLWLSALLLCCAAISGQKDFYLFFTSCAFVGIVGVYSTKCLRKLNLKAENGLLLKLTVACAALLFTVYVGGIGVSRYLAYRTPAYDFGIFAQAFYSLKTRLIPYTTCERGYELSHFSVHFSPIFYLALPVYLIYPSPETVQMIQSAALALAVIPLWLIARKIGLSKKAAAFFCLLYLVYPALTGGCMYDFHENCFLPLTLLWLIYFMEKNSTFGALVFALLSCSVKEDAAVYVAFIGLFFIFSGKRKRLGAGIFAFSLIYFLCVCWYINEFGLGIMTYRYDNLSDDGSLMGVIKTALTDPFRVLKEALETEKLQFAGWMLLPLGLLPFATKKISRYILLGGMLLVNLMPDYVYQYSIDFQYVFGPLALMFYMSMMNFADISPSAKRGLAAFACSAAIISASARMPSHLRYFQYLEDLRPEIEVLNEAMEYVPDGVSVSCSTFIIANLSDRDEIYSIEDMQLTDYVVVDLRYSEWDKYPGLYSALGYKTVYQADDVVCIMKNGETAE